MARMRPLRIGAGLSLALLTLLSPTRGRAACSRDDDCTGGLICVRGQCASPVDPGSQHGPGTLGARDRKRGACLQRCDHDRTKCLSRVMSVSNCISRERKNCTSKCQRQGGSAKECAADCNSSERRNLWEPDCAVQGDAARQSCQVQQESCLRACGRAS